MSFDVIPAMDLQGGKVVRLRQGDLENAQVYERDPIELAREFKQAGARWLHIVDLDGAKFGHLSVHFETAAKIVREVGIPVQFGGGIREMSHIDRAIKTGISRVVLGTAAISYPHFAVNAIQQYPGKIAIGIDVRDGKMAIEAWKQHSNLNPFEFARMMERAGAAAIIATSISHDGMLNGIDKNLMRAFAASLSEIPLIASGGVGKISHIAEMAAEEESGISGVILGKAYYQNLVPLPAALKFNRN